MSLPLLALGRTAFALYSVQEATGVLGWDDLASAFGKLLVKMELKAHRHHADALAQMIDEARANVPVDTGLLLNGITGETTDDYCEFRASAVRTTAGGKQSEDYAHFVEFGTQPGARGATSSYQSRVGLFSAPPEATSIFATGATSPRTRKQYRSHPGTQAQPFFFPAVDDVIGQVNARMEYLPFDAASEDGWEVGA